MPPPLTDGSSVISETKRSNVSVRDGGLCVLCGDDPVDVAHIIARKSGDTGQVSFIHSISPSLSGFRKDEYLNLICLCASHHRQFDAGFFVFVPSKLQRKVLLDHEERNFASRELLVANGQPDPGRSFPTISDEIEYIPIHGTRFRAYFHHPTCYDQTMFSFDTVDRVPCLELHFQASPICLMIHAQPHLCKVTRLRIDRADMAQSDVNTLLELYRRSPKAGCDNSIAVPVGYHHDPVGAMQPYNNYCSAHILPTIPSSPPLSHPTTSTPMSNSFGHHLKMPELTPSSSASTMASEDTETDPDLMDPQLIEYAKERAVTWEDLKTRPPLFPGEDGGTWQFSNAENVIRSWQ